MEEGKSKIGNFGDSFSGKQTTGQDLPLKANSDKVSTWMEDG